jgi:hypothetical protein
MKFPMAYLGNPSMRSKLGIYDPISNSIFVKRRGHFDASLVKVIFRSQQNTQARLHDRVGRLEINVEK